MFTKINTYIFRHLALATLLITVALTAIIWLTQSLRFIDVVFSKSSSPWLFFHLITFLLPDLVSIVLPSAVLIAILFIYNRFNTENELLVFRAVGMSHWQLAKPALFLATLVTLLLYGITLYILPHAFRNLRDLEHEIRHSISAAVIQEGEFNTLRGLTIYIQHRESPRHLKGILVHNAQENTKPYTLSAEHGSVVGQGDKARLILINGIRYEVDPKTGTPSMLYFDQYTLDLNADNLGDAPQRVRKPYEYFITELFDPDDEMAPSFSQKQRFRIQAHQKIIGPLHALLFALIGVCVFLYGDYNRRGQSRGLTFALGACCGLQLATLTLTNLAEKVTFALPLLYGVIGIPILLCLGFLLEFCFTKRNKSLL